MSKLWQVWCDLWKIDQKTEEPSGHDSTLTNNELDAFQAQLLSTIESPSTSYFNLITTSFCLFKSHHTEPWRHYHTLEHIEQCVEFYIKYKANFYAPQIVLLSLLFHDIIYNPRSSTNEADSAKLTTTVLVSIQHCLPKSSTDFPWFDNDSISHIHEFILATQTHTIPLHYQTLLSTDNIENNVLKTITTPTQPTQPTQNPTNSITFQHSSPHKLTSTELISDLSWVLDIDMSILASSPENFQRYEKGIRNEYIFVPLAIYKEKRGEIMCSFAKQTPLFLTTVMFNEYEHLAKENLSNIDTDTYCDP